MARTDAQMKGLYYPTPEPLIPGIIRFFHTNYPAAPQEIRLLDPCVGKGRALALLADNLRAYLLARYQRVSCLPKVITYGIEPNIARVKEAKKVIDHVLHASYFQALTSNGDAPDGGFQLAFVNPPYDWDKEILKKSGAHERLEVTFLQRTTQKLCPNGVLIWIVPLWVVERAAIHLSQWYRGIEVRCFPNDPFATPEMIADGQSPAPMFEMFNQVVVIAQKRHNENHEPRVAERLVKLATEKEPMRFIGPLSIDGSEDLYHGEYIIPWAARPLRYWSTNRYDADESARQLAILKKNENNKPDVGVYSKLKYWEQRWPSELNRKLSIGRPLAPLKQGFRALMAVAGIINGAILRSEDGREVIVKGFTTKRQLVKVSEDDESVTTTKKDVYETALWCIEMTPGENHGKLIRVQAGTSTETFDLPHEEMSLSVFLNLFGVALTEQITKNNPSLYSHPDQVPWAAQAFAQMTKRQPLGRQRDFILAIVNALAIGGDDWTRMTRVGEIAEMATGKTYLSLATLFLSDLYVNGLAHLLPKRHEGNGSRRRPIHAKHFAPALVICPEIIAKKWKREAEETIPNVKAVVVQRIDSPAKAREFRQFDPSWNGDRLSAVGCIERVIKKIDHDLKVWQSEYEKAKRAGMISLPKKPCHLVVIPNNTAKLGMSWSPVYQLRPLFIPNDDGKTTMQRNPETLQPILVPCCTSCYSPVRDEEGQYLFEKDIVGSGEKRKKLWCKSCGETLWQYLTGAASWKPQTVLCGDTCDPLPLPDTLDNLPVCIKDTHSRRYPIADYIRKFHSGFFKMLISDEIHQGAEGTALDFARRSLIDACGSYLGLTGTLCNGYSSSLFPFVWSINEEVRERFAYNGTGDWVDQYGARKIVTRVAKGTDSGDGAISKRKTGGKSVESELPSFAPNGLPTVFNKCGFLELIDVAPSLPPYTEEVDIIPMGEPLGKIYEDFERIITSELGSMLVRGDKSGLSAWFQALRRQPNLPYLGWTCQVKKSGYCLGSAPALPEKIIYPKEQRIIDLVQQELENNRKVIIYCEETGEYDIQPRYEELIGTHVMPRNGNVPKISILRSSGRGAPKTIDREEWLINQVKEGCNVLICNSALVQVGLDLVDFHTILVPSIPASTSQMRQAFRRIHRPRQTKPTKVILLVYPTMELRLLRLMSNKMKTALMVEGQLPGQGLVSLSSGEGDAGEESDFMIALAREVQVALSRGETSLDVMKEAEALQQEFRESAQLEQEQNAYIGVSSEESNVQPLLSPITFETLSSQTEEEPLPPIIIVPVALSGDPWEALRAKRDALVRKKRLVIQEIEPSLTLWGDDLPVVVIPATAAKPKAKKAPKKTAKKAAKK